MRTETANALLACGAGAIVACSVPAQDMDPQDVLRGPSVPEHRAQSLVQHTMTGELVLIEGRPEMAAVQLLELDAQIVERARQVERDRADALAMLLVDELDLLKQMTDLQSEAGGAERANELFHEMWSALEPDQPRDPLMVPLAEVLAPEEIDRAQELVDEYWSAVINAYVRRQHGDLEGDERLQAEFKMEEQLKLQMFHREVLQAYETSIKRYHDSLQALYVAIEPDPEQKAAIRSLVIEHIKETRLQPTIAQRREVMMNIYRMLDESRRELLYSYMVGIVLPE